MEFSRSAGILLHISSLPSCYGVGDLGKCAYDWVDFLNETGTGLWQILPYHPPGEGNSPYQGLSAFAGNPLFIDPQFFIDNGLLTPKHIAQYPNFPNKSVDFKLVGGWKNRIFKIAFQEFVDQNATNHLNKQFERFITDNSKWLDNSSLFMAIREKFNQSSWRHWPKEFRFRDKKTLSEFREKHFHDINYQKFIQFVFFSQWRLLHKYALKKGIRIIGDIPIFMGYDSADVWSHPNLFQLDDNLIPYVVAGVPPDYFSSDGQLWGNPLYAWEEHKQNKFSWWINRVKYMRQMVDVIRLDHFRGFSAAWEIPKDSLTAKNGKWVEGPTYAFFNAIKDDLNDLPFFAEDLGVITPEVTELRDHYKMPGMRIMQFGFGESGNSENLPENFPINCVAYTGTHDNPPTRGWFNTSPDALRKSCSQYLRGNEEEIAHLMIQAIWESPAVYAIAPMQDFLNLRNNARMNTPSVPLGNWAWRMSSKSITPKLIEWIKDINFKNNRSIKERIV